MGNVCVRYILTRVYPSRRRVRNYGVGHVQYFSTDCYISQDQRSEVHVVEVRRFESWHEFTFQYSAQAAREEESLGCLADSDPYLDAGSLPGQLANRSVLRAGAPNKDRVPIL